jgi:hypothetical protein
MGNNAVRQPGPRLADRLLLFPPHTRRMLLRDTNELLVTTRPRRHRKVGSIARTHGSDGDNHCSTGEYEGRDAQSVPPLQAAFPLITPIARGPCQYGVIKPEIMLLIRIHIASKDEAGDLCKAKKKQIVAVRATDRSRQSWFSNSIN